VPGITEQCRASAAADPRCAGGQIGPPGADESGAFMIGLRASLIISAVLLVGAAAIILLGRAGRTGSPDRSAAGS
jgi:hypothetical protein